MQFVGRLAKFWLILTFVGSAGYFGYFNREHITITLPPWSETFSVPAYTAYIAFFAAGAFVASVYVGLETFRKSFEIRRLSKRLRELEPTSTYSRPRTDVSSPAIDPSPT